MAAFQPKRFSEPEWLRSIAPERLLALLANWKVYLEERGFPFPSDPSALDYSRLGQILLSVREGTPPSLNEALHLIYETSSPEDMEALTEARRRARQPTIASSLMTPADYACAVWLTDRASLEDRHAEALARAQKSFIYFGGKRDGPNPFPEHGEATQRAIEQKLDAWFIDKGRGTNCRVFFFKGKKLVWVVVRHGEPMRREPVHRDDGVAASEFYRPQKHDVLTYDTRNGELGVHADTKGERELYLRTLGCHLFSGEDHFPLADKYTLVPLVNDGEASLACKDVEGIDRILLVKYQVSWGGAYQEIDERRATNIFAALAQRGHAPKLSHEPSMAVFKIRFTGAKKDRSVTIRTTAVARYDRDSDSEVVEEWLRRRGFLLNGVDVADEDQDDEASALLEGAR